MPLNLASPGIVVREVDLTIGRTTPSSNKTGGLVAPFAKGPINVPTLVENENDLLTIFGKPYSLDNHYEYWLSASSYLAYGGSLRIVRADNSKLANGFIGISTSTTGIKINSLDHYGQLGYDINPIKEFTFVAKNPGSWSNGISVSIIDAKADQILVGVQTNTQLADIQVGYGITQAIDSTFAGIGTTSILNGHLKGIITGVAGTNISVKVLSYISNGVETQVDYQPSGTYAFKNTGSITITATNGSSALGSTSYTSQLDWFDQQKIGISSSTFINWNNIAPRPSTTSYATARNSRFDEVHIVIIDKYGSITGNAGSILEKHLSLSKASDAQFSVGSPSYWRKYLASNSGYVFGGSSPSGITTCSFNSGPDNFALKSDTDWDQEVNGVTFACCGAITNELKNGKDYDAKQIGVGTDTGALSSDIGDLTSGYDLFESGDTFKTDFLLMGSGSYTKEKAQALANKIISIAELKKDAIAFISPYRGAFITDTADSKTVTVKSAADITESIISFYSPITSSSYAVFDSGYKYMYDRFSDTFRYVPLNGDIAGVCARNDINNFPWFSPAGTTRGTILNAVKLAYNPTQSQKDRLYSNRINPVVFSPGAGIVLFGDRTGLGRASAFDRINVRRLFIYLEDAISQAAKDQLFEFNDEVTRTNFVNTIEPFLRDIQSKRGIFDYVVICDETNNTASVIDNNEFVADIYIKPTRSINFIGLTFIATKTGVDFQEIIGNV